MVSPISLLERFKLTLGSAAVALANPGRADMVALVGDLTSGPVLTQLVRRVNLTTEGREMLSSLSPKRFPENGSASLGEMRSLRDGTLGREYARFMDRRQFTPESRDIVRFVEYEHERWVLQRYRDVHDLWHVLTGLPPTLLGEIAQKWFEASHTGLPVAAFSAIAGPARLSWSQRRVLVTRLVPWALSCGIQADNLLAIRYENYLDVDVDELRRRWCVSVPDVKIKGMA